jgi:hypothetical protein
MVAFSSGRIGGKGLKPGRYRAVFTASDAAEPRHRALCDSRSSRGDV